MEELINNSNSSGMTVFPLNNLTNWQERVTKIACDHGLEVIQRGSNITIWNSGDITPLTYGWRYAQAWRVARESYGKDQSGLGVKSVRVYFQGNEVRPSSVPENVLSKERYNAPNTPEDRIGYALEFGKTFSVSFKGLQEKPVQFEFLNNSTDLLGGLAEGERVEVSFRIEGKKWGEKILNNLIGTTLFKKKEVETKDKKSTRKKKCRSFKI